MSPPPTSPPIMDATDFCRALERLGWTPNYLGRRLNIREDTVRKMKTGKMRVPDNLAEWLMWLLTVLDQYPQPKDWRFGVPPPTEPMPSTDVTDGLIEHAQ